MQTIPSYISWLLTKHECVIVPGLGAFVVSGREAPDCHGAGLLAPSAKFLGFNPDIRHNDGLLAHTIARAENCSYQEARLQIARYVDRIRGQAEKQLPVQLPWIGTLALSVGRQWLFTPAGLLSCNADTFGMDSLYLPAIEVLNEATDKARPSVVRRTLAIAATVLALLTVAIPLTDQSTQHRQMAGLIARSSIRAAETADAVEEEPAESPIAETTPYYIVIASLPTDSLARIQMAALQKQGLPDLGIVGNGNRHRVYAAKFGDKTEANRFLIRFRNEWPLCQDAWLLTLQEAF
jgi:hypothetical protein